MKNVVYRANNIKRHKTNGRRHKNYKLITLFSLIQARTRIAPAWTTLSGNPTQDATSKTIIEQRSGISQKSKRHIFTRLLLLQAPLG